MKKTFIIMVVAALSLSCGSVRQSKVVGKYRSICIYQGYWMLNATFYPDGTFLYKMPYVKDIEGTWEIKKDTLKLYSEKFNIEDRVLDITTIITSIPEDWRYPNEYNKYTNLDDIDAYLIRGKKLYKLTKDGGHTKDCYLKKIK